VKNKINDPLWRIFCLALMLVTACSPEKKQVSPTATLPPPQVRIVRMTSTPIIPTLEPVVAESTPTATQEQVQAWPTTDDEQFLLDQIDGLINKIDQTLNNTDTKINP
jgi:hypothetical protein